MGVRISLTDMVKGQRGTVISVKGRGAFGKRIRDMGIIPGSPLVVEGEAPLGDPMEIKVMGYNLTLRRNEARHILVELEG